jgi:DNA end-binding protein Ku
VGYKRYNKQSGREVPWDEVVKGYEYERGRYVVMSDEDFRRANVEATQTVDIVGFVEADRIPPVYYDTPYYLAPAKRGEKGYALLRETLRKSGKAGLANVVIRTRQHLALLLPVGPMLVLDTLRYAGDIRPISEFDLPAESAKGAKVSDKSDKELDMALKLVEGMTEKWDPDKFHDSFRADILKRVKEKVKAGETELITEPGGRHEQPKGAKVIDLMALLKRSVETAGKGTGRAGAPRDGSARRRRAPHKAVRQRARNGSAERRRHA